MPLRDLNLVPGMELFTLSNPEVAGAIVSPRKFLFFSSSELQIGAGATAEIEGVGRLADTLGAQDALYLESIIGGIQCAGSGTPYTVNSAGLYLLDGPATNYTILDLAPTLALTPLVGGAAASTTAADSPIVQAGPLVLSLGDLNGLMQQRNKTAFHQPLGIAFSTWITNTDAAAQFFNNVVQLIYRVITGVNP